MFESLENSFENKLENLLNSGEGGSVSDYVKDMRVRVEATFNPIANNYDLWVIDVTRNDETESFTKTVKDKSGIEDLMDSILLFYM